MIFATGITKAGKEYNGTQIQAADLANAYGLPPADGELKIQYQNGNPEKDRHNQLRVPASIWPPTSFMINNGDGTTIHLEFCQNRIPSQNGQGYRVITKDIVLVGTDNNYTASSYEEFVITALGPMTTGSPAISNGVQPVFNLFDRRILDLAAKQRTETLRSAISAIENMKDETLRVKGMGMADQIGGIASTSTIGEIRAQMFVAATKNPERILTLIKSEEVGLRGVLLKAIEDDVIRQESYKWVWNKGQRTGSLLMKYGEDEDPIRSLVRFLTPTENYQIYYPELIRLTGVNYDAGGEQVKIEEAEELNLDAAKFKLFELANKGVLQLTETSFKLGDTEYQFTEEALAAIGSFDKVLKMAETDSKIKGAITGAYNKIK